MRKFIIILFFLLFIPVISFASIPDSYNEPTSTFAKNNIPSIPADAVFVGPGTYYAGTDIPTGDYRLDAECYGCYIKFNFPDTDNAYNLYFGRNFGLTTISRLPVVEGSSITINYNGIYFTPAEYERPSETPFILYPGIYFPGIDFPAGTYLLSNNDKIKASVRQKKYGKYSSNIFYGDIADQTKFEFTDDTFVCIADFSVVVSEYVSPFNKFQK